MRKSSLSKAEKNFQVFNRNDHVNQYENLQEPAVEDANGSLDGNDDFIAFDESSSEGEDGEEGNEEEEEGNETVNNDGEEVAPSVNTDYPWILNHDHSKQREIADWLTLEIRDFVAYISPSKEEIELRNRTIGMLRQAVSKLWPGSDMQVFGSYATDLYLPGSDIDCVINSKMGDKENKSSLYELAHFLKSRKLATQVEVIAKARVPIIKFVEPSSQIHIDVSFERTNGLEAAKLIRSWLEQTPGLRELVLIVKQFLHARRLNNVHTGGLGGFSIICLVYAFLNLHPRIITGEIDARYNLGVLLIDFFELYGKNFGYDDVAVVVADQRPCYMHKSDWTDLRLSGGGSFTLAIQDPGDPSNNISRSSFNLRDIKKAFAGGFDLLTNRCFELDSATFKGRVGQSILGNVIRYRGKLRDFNDDRDLVANSAIIENEKYHKKRSRIVHDQADVFVDFSGSDSENLKEEQDSYLIQEPERPLKKRRQTKTVDELMGVPNEDEEDDYNPLNREASKTNTLKSATVDAQTRRDYWLNKGNSLSSQKEKK